MESGARLPYQERIRLKKLAQRRRMEGDKKRKMKIATLNVGTMNGRGRKIVDAMQRKRVEILCGQESGWKGQKAKEGYEIYYSGEDSKRNGVGIIASQEMKERVLQVSRNSSSSMTMKLEMGRS